MTERDDKLFVEQIRQQLDSSTDQLDELSVARLRAARIRALETTPRNNRSWLALATATAAVAVLAILLWQGPSGLPGPVDELDIIASGEDLELIEDLDFYDWLDATQTTG